MNDLQHVMKEAREALEKATPGPWKVIEQVWEEDKPFLAERHIVTVYDYPQLKSPDPVVCMSHCVYEPKQRVYIDEHDAHLIAQAPTWLSTLLSALEEQQREINAIKLITENERLEKNRAWDKNDRLLEQNAAMKSALEWYGEDGTYAIPHLGCAAMVMSDKGERARTVLSSLSKEESNETS